MGSSGRHHVGFQMLQQLHDAPAPAWARKVGKESLERAHRASGRRISWRYLKIGRGSRAAAMRRSVRSLQIGPFAEVTH